MAAIDNDVSDVELVEEDEEGTSVVYSVNGTVRRREDVSVLRDQGASSATTRTSRGIWRSLTRSRNWTTSIASSTTCRIDASQRFIEV